jgi:uncharacterized membrane protein
MNTDAKTISIISYLTLIGWVIAMVLHGNNKTELAAFHLRQSLGLMLTGLVLSFIPLLGLLLALVMLVFWVLGLISAIKEEQKPLPLIGEFYQQFFRTLI